MKIETVTEAEYIRLLEIVKKSDALLREKAPHVFEHGGVIPDSVAEDKAFAAATNEVKGKVEQYELYHNTPDTFVAYIGKPNLNGVGIDRKLGQSYSVTVWTGLPIGIATKGSTWRVNSSFGSEMHQFYARVNGRDFTGRGFGEGMAVKFRETAESFAKRKKAGVV